MQANAAVLNSWYQGTTSEITGAADYLGSGITMLSTTAGFAKYTYHGTEPYLDRAWHFVTHPSDKAGTPMQMIYVHWFQFMWALIKFSIFHHGKKTLFE